MSIEEQRLVAEAARSYWSMLDEACASACKIICNEGAYSGFELEEGDKELGYLSSKELDLAYDRPSIGLHYTLLYHLERTHLLVRGLLPLLVGRRKPLHIYDMGCGSGATAWATAVIMEACREVGVEVSQVRVYGWDTSPFMLDAADKLWKTLPDRFKQYCTPDNRLGSWDRVSNQTDEVGDGLIVCSYLFNASDYRYLEEVKSGLTRLSDRVGADQILLLTPSRKKNLADNLTALAASGNWNHHLSYRPYHHDMWTDIPDRTCALRQHILGRIGRNQAGVTRAYKTLQANRRHQVYRLLSRESYAPPVHGTSVWNCLSDKQGRIATPHDRLTYVVGAAGSGKSVVLIERLVQCIERARRSPDILVTSFNKEMVDKLIQWTRDRINFSKTIDKAQVIYVSSRERGVGTIKVRTRDGPDAIVRFLNFDKLPHRVWAKPHKDLMTLEYPLNQPDNVLFDIAPIARWSVDFIEDELRHVVYGLEAMTFGEYTDTKRTVRRGRGKPGLRRRQRVEIWPRLRDQLAARSDNMTFLRPRIGAWRHNKKVLLHGGQMDLRPRFRGITHVFVDEAQDMMRPDIRMLAHTPPRPQRLFVVGDSTQALHSHGMSRRPEIIHTRWVAPIPRLSGSYRLPALLCAALSDLAESVLGEQQRRGADVDGDDGARNDERYDEFGAYGGVPQVSRSAVPGPRPVIVDGTRRNGMARAMKTMQRFNTHAELSGSTWHIVQEGPRLSKEYQRFGNVSGLSVCQLSMLSRKGLERSLVVFPTDGQPPSGKSVPEWVYAALTRARAVLMIAVNPSETDAAVAKALSELKGDKLMFWDQAAKDAWHAMLGGVGH